MSLTNHELLDLLGQENLLDQTILDIISSHKKADLLLNSVKSLKEASLLTQDYFLEIAVNPQLFHLARCLDFMLKNGILHQENLNRLLVCKHLLPLSGIMSRLHNYHLLLSQENFERLISSFDPFALTSVYYRLITNGLFDQTNFNLVLQQPNPDKLDHLLMLLDVQGHLSPHFFNLIVNHLYLNNSTQIVEKLAKNHLLTPVNLEAVLNKSTTLSVLSKLIDALDKQKILIQKYFDFMTKTESHKEIIRILDILRQSNLFDASHLNELMLPEHHVLLTERCYVKVLRKLDRITHWTPDNFQKILQAAKHPLPYAALEIASNQILGLIAGAQGIHTTSVHQTASISASHLMQRYGSGLDVATKVQEILSFILSLESSAKVLAAKRCVERLNDPCLAYEDPRSKVSNLELLVLSFIAIHDDSKREGSLDDAKAIFIDGLYEIQRGYNIDAGQDASIGDDKPICTSGTFNKLIEKLNGIHREIELRVVTKAGAGAKMSIIAKEEALNYLRTLATTQAQECLTLIQVLRSDTTVAPIWAKIQDKVSLKLWEEFKEAYGENQDDPTFQTLINFGCDVDIPDLSAIENLCRPSPISSTSLSIFPQAEAEAEDEDEDEAQQTAPLKKSRMG